jgi:hypothetical protein
MSLTPFEQMKGDPIPSQSSIPTKAIVKSPFDLLKESNVHTNTSGLYAPISMEKYTPYMDQVRFEKDDIDEVRAQNQSSWEVAGHGLLRLGATALTKTAQGFGHVGGAVAGLATWDASKWYDNAWVNTFHHLEESIKEGLPIYHTKHYLEGNVWQQMGHLSFWADDVVDGAAFMLSAIAGGYITKPIQIGDKMASLARMSARAINAGKSGKAASAAFAGGWDLATITAYNTINEAGFEAKDIKDNIVKQLIFDRERGLNNFSDEEINLRGSEGAINTAGWNSAALLLSNAIQAKMFFGKSGINKDLYKAAYKGTNPILESAWTKAAKNIPIAWGSEGLWEENVQHAIQTYESSRAKRKIQDADWHKGVLSIANEMVNNLTTDDGQKAIVLGMIIGTFGAVGSSVNKVNQERGQYELIKERVENAKNLYTTGVQALAKQFNEIGEDGKPTENKTFINPATGKSEVDPNVALQSFFQIITNKQLFEEKSVAAAKGDKLAEKIIDDIILSRAAFEFFSKEGEVEGLEAFLEAAAESAKEEQEDDPHNIDSRLASKKQKASKLFKHYEAIKDRLEIADKENHFGKAAIAKALFYEAVKRASLEEFVAEKLAELGNQSGAAPLTKDEVERINKSIEFARAAIVDSQKTSQDIRENQDKLADDYKTSAERQLETAKKLGELQKIKPADLTKEQKIELEHILENSAIHGDLAELSKYHIVHPEAKRVNANMSMYDEYYFKKGMDYEISDKINQMVEEGKPFRDILNYIASKKHHIGPNTKELIKQLTDVRSEEIDKLNAEKQSLFKDIESVFMDNVEAFEEAEIYHPSEIESEIKGLENESKVILDTYTRIEEIENTTSEIEQEKDFVAFMNVDEATKASDKKQKDIEDAEKDNTMDEYFRREVADYVFNLPAILKNIHDEAPDKFSADGMVRRAVNELEWKLEYVKAKKIDESRHFKDFEDKVNEALEEMKKLLETAEQNKANRSVEQARFARNNANKKFLSIGLKEGQIVNQALYDQIEQIVGKSVLDQILEDAKNDGWESTYAEIILELAKSVSTKEQKSAIIKLVDDSVGVKIEAVLNSAAISKDTGSIYKINPARALYNIIVGNSKVPGDVGIIDNPTIEKYYNEKDVFNLLDELDNSGLPADVITSLKEVLTNHIEVISLYELRDRFNSDYKFTDQVAAEKRVLLQRLASNPNTLVPTAQQLIAIRELSEFYHSHSTDAQYSGWAYMKGLAGTGKTTVVMSWLKDILGLSASNIYTFSHNEHSSKTISDSLGTANKTIQDFIAEDKFDGVKLIVIDEIAAIDNTTLHNIASKISAINKTRKDKIKVITLGDPSQITASSLPQINHPDPANSSIARVREITPLTVRYRSDVAPIVNIQDAYQNKKTPVSGLDAVSTTLENGAVIGVEAGKSTDDVIAAIEKNKQFGRKQLVIVGTEAEKVKYAGTGVEVVTYIEAQGRTESEVYIDLNRSLFPSEALYNTAMYTATSRAAHYLFVNEPTYKNTVDPKLNQTTGQRNEEITNNRVEFGEQKTKEEELLKKYVKTYKPVTTPVHTQSPVSATPAGTAQDDDEDFNEPEDTEEEIQEEESKVLVTKIIGTPPPTGGQQISQQGETFLHDLASPTYDAITAKSMQGESMYIAKPGDKVIYVREYDPTTGEYYIKVLAQISLDGKPTDNYGVIGYVTKEEYATPFGKLLLDKLNQTPKTKRSFIPSSEITSDKGIIGKLDSNAEIFYEGTLEYATPLNYQYSPKVQHRGKGLLADLMNRFKRYFGNRQPEDSNLAENRIIAIFPSSRDVKGKYDTHGLALKPGIPYLILVNPKQKSDNTTVTKTQYIRLNPRPINKDQDAELMEPLIQLRDSLAELENLMGLKYGTKEFNSVISKYKDGFKIENFKVVPKESGSVISAEEFNQTYSTTEGQRIKELFDQIIPLLYGARTTERRFKTLEEAEEYLAQTKDKPLADNYKIQELKSKNKKTGEETITYRIQNNALDTASTPGVKPHYVQSEELASSQGIAQKSLNKIVQANSHIEGVSLRVHRFDINLKGRTQPYTTAKSLVTSDANIAGTSKLLRGILKKEGYTFKHLTTEEEIDNVIEFIQKEFGDRYNEEIEKERSKVVEAINIDMLNKLVNFDSDGNHNSGTYHLRVPLHMPTVNKLGEDLNNAENVEKLESMLEHKLEQVNPTRIVVKVDTGTKTEVVPEVVEEAPTQGTKSAVDYRRGRGRRLGKEVESKLGNKITLAKAVKLAKKLMPGITEDNLKFLVREQLARVAEGDSVWGLMLDGVVYVEQEDGMIHENVLRHEIFHRIFNYYLTLKEQDMLIKSFQKQYPEAKYMSAIEFEEALAEKYQEYRNGNKGFRYAILTFFRRIAAWLGFVNKNLDNVQKFFETLDNGLLHYGNPISNAGARRTMLDIKRDFKNTTNYRNLIDETIGRLHEYQQEGISGFPATRQEIINKVFDDYVRTRNKVITEIQEVKQSQDENRESKLQELTQRLEELEIITKITSKGKSINRPNFKTILEALYPSKSIAVNEDEVVEEMEGQEDGNTITKGISDHTIETDRINQETKLSDNIKDVLANIQYEINGEPAFLNSRYAYLKTLHLMEGLDFSSPNIIEQINEALNKEGANAKNRAIAQTLINIINQATEYNIPNGYVFLNENTFAYTENPDINLHKLTFSEMLLINKAEKGTIKFITRNGLQKDLNKEDISTKELMQSVLSTLSLDKDTLIKLWNKRDAANTLAELVTNFNSQREKNLKIGEIEMEFGRRKMKYFHGKTLGIKQGIRGYLEGLFIDNYLSIDKPESLFKAEDKAGSVINFLKAVGIPDAMLQDLPNFNMDLLYTNLEKFVERSKDIGNTVQVDSNRVNVEGKEIINDDLEDIEVTLYDIIDDSNSMFNDLVEWISHNNTSDRATSVMDGEGKKLYLYHNSSQGMDTLSLLSRRYKDRGKVPLPKHLTTDFFKLNMLNQARAIKSVVDHDSIKLQDKATPYPKETPSQWIDRNFQFGFLANIAQSRKAATVVTYDQFIWTISNRPRIIAAEVNALTPELVKDGIRRVLEQMTQRSEYLQSTIDNYRINSTINFEILDKAAKHNKEAARFLENPKEVFITNAVIEALYSELEKISLDFARLIVKEGIILDRSLPSIYKILKDKGLIDVKYENHKLTNVSPKGEFLSRDKNRNYIVTPEEILPIVDTFVKNNYINSYFANQLVVGDSAFFKSGLDVVKRMSGVFAPGQKGWAGNYSLYGEKFKVLITKDVKGILSNEIFKDSQAFGEDFDKADAQGFMLPERADAIKAGFGDAYGVSAIMKPAHYEVVTVKDPNTGKEVSYPVMLKYSSVVLTDELVAKYPQLANLRENMRRLGAGEMVFKSGVKVGAPHKTLLDAVDTQKLFDDPEYTSTLADPNSVLRELSNNKYRLQLNPHHDPEDGHTAYPSQLAYFLNILGANEERAFKFYDITAKLISRGNDRLNKKLSDAAKEKGRVIDALNSPGSERVRELLMEGISPDFPTLNDKYAMQLASIFSKDTVKIDFKGGKLILQSSQGVQIRDLKTGRMRELQYEVKDGRLVAETIIPKGILTPEQEEAIEKGEEVYVLPDMMGFRIPSSELHSAIPLKVVGFYPTSKTNIIIVPPDVVKLHGSDFDVDSLFVLSRDVFRANPLEFTPGVPVGYKLEKGKYVIDEDFESTINRMLEENRGDNRKITALEKILDSYYKNMLIEIFLDVITDEANRKRMSAPISMDRFNGKEKLIDEKGEPIIGDNGKQLEDFKKDSIFYIIRDLTGKLQNKADLTNPLSNLDVYRSNFEGAALTGAFANNMKALAYMSKANKGEMGKLGLPTLNKTFTFNGKTFDSLSDFEYNRAGVVTEHTIWETMDSLLNAAIDNVKEQILPIINANKITGNSLSIMIASGVPLNTAVLFLRQPAVMALSSYPNAERGMADLASKLRAALSAETKEKQLQNKDYLDSTIELVDLNEDNMAEYVKRYPDVTTFNPADLVDEQIIHQLKVLETFRTLYSLGEDLGSLSRALGIVQNIPALYNKLEDNIEAWSKIGEIKDGKIVLNESFGFNISDLLDRLPHVKAALEVRDNVRSRIKARITKHSDIVENFVKNLDVSTSKMSGTEKVEDDKKELIKYLVSSIYDFSNEVPYSYTRKGKKGEDRTITMTGAKAFSQNFANTLRKVQDLNIKSGFNNQFLKALEVSKDKFGTHSLRFVMGANIEYADMLDLIDSFEELSAIKFDKNGEPTIGEYLPMEEYTEFQKDFLKYAVVNYGMTFGVTNYSLVLPVNLLKEADTQIKEVFDKVKETPEGKDLNTLEKLRDSFRLQLAANHPKELPYVKVRKDSNGDTLDSDKAIAREINGRKTYSGFDPKIGYYDLTYKQTFSINDKGERKADREFPSLIHFGGNWPQAFVRINDAQSETVYYAKVGRSFTSHYDLSKNTLNFGYDMVEHFRPDIRHVNVSNNKASVHDQPIIDKVGVGQIVAIYNNSDFTRAGRRFVEVVEANDLTFTVDNTERSSSVKPYTPSIQVKSSKLGEAKAELRNDIEQTYSGELKQQALDLIDSTPITSEEDLGALKKKLCKLG